MNNLTKICIVLSTISLILIATDAWLWTFIDLNSDTEDFYEMHLKMHEGVDN